MANNFIFVEIQILKLLKSYFSQSPHEKIRIISFNPPSRSASADEKIWVNFPGLAPEERVQGFREC
jgi:hypothetical protein